MSRNGSGTYTLPSGNPVVSGTIIESTWANTTLSDIASALTDSLSRSGQGGMTAPLRLFDGTSLVPGLAWSNETATGFYRAGAGDTRLVVTGSQVMQFLATGVAVTGTLSTTGAITATGGLIGNVTGNVSGNAGTVTNGVYTTGDQTIGGTKTFSNTISGSITGNAGTVTNGVYTTGNQTIGGTKTFSSTISGSVSGNAGTATTLQTARTINGVSFDGSANITVTANTSSLVTFNNGGAGGASGSTFNGSGALTVSYNTVGAPSTTGANASGNWGINVTGNAATVTNGVYTTGDQNIAGQKRFSSSVVVGGTSVGAANFDIQTTGASVINALLTTGVSDLNFRLGAANGVAGSSGTTQSTFGLFYLGSGETATIAFRRGSGATDGSFAFRTSGNDRATLDNSGNFTATGNITANSDERLKTDWADLGDDFIERLAEVKVGTFTRVDSGERQVGVSAQSLQPVVPEAVLKGEHLSVAYGNAALAAAIALARGVVSLRRELNEMKGA